MQNCVEENKEKWLDYWQDDMLDRTKTHLSQYDKRSLLYGGFMVGITTVLLCSLGIFIGNSWADNEMIRLWKRFYGHLLPIWHWQQKMSMSK